MPAKVRSEVIPGGIREVYPSGITQELYDPPRADGLLRVVTLPEGIRTIRTEVYRDGRIKETITKEMGR